MNAAEEILAIISNAVKKLDVQIMLVGAFCEFTKTRNRPAVA